MWKQQIRCPVKRERKSSGSGGAPASAKGRHAGDQKLTDVERRATEGRMKFPRTTASLKFKDPSGLGNPVRSKRTDRHEKAVADGEGIAGYLRPASLRSIIVHLRDRCRMRSKGSVFCDIGCGEGRVIMSVMEACPRLGGVIGFDSSQSAIVAAQGNMTEFLSRRFTGVGYVKDGPPDPAPPRCILQRNVKRLPNLMCVTHAYSFCNGFPPNVLRHLFRVCAGTPSLRYLTLAYRKADLASQVIARIREISVAVHDFQDLTMGGGGGTAGCCFRISDGVRRVLHEASEGTSAESGGTASTLQECLFVQRAIDK